MKWEESVFAMFDDLEQQAEGLALADRDAEVAELSVAEYAQIGLAARLHASIGQDLTLRLLGGQTLHGRLVRVGEDWVMVVDDAGVELVVRCEAILSFHGLSRRAASKETWSVVDRLTLRALLRRLSAQSSSCTIQAMGGQVLEGRVGRVGRDFVELVAGEASSRATHVVPLHGIAVLRSQV